MSGSTTKQSDAPQDEHLEAFNVRAQAELNAERQALVSAYLEHKSSTGGALDFTSPAVLAVISTRAAQAAINISRTDVPIKDGKPNSAAPTSSRALHGALFAAATAVVIGAPALMLSDDAAKLKAWTDLVSRVCTSALAAGISIKIVDTIRFQLIKRTPELLERLGSVGTAVCSSSAVAGTFVAAFEIIKALWHLLQATMARLDGDDTTQREHMDKAKRFLSLDTACRVAAGAITAAVLGSPVGAALLPASPALALIVEVVVYWVTTSMVEHIIQRKNHYGGWLTWFRTFFQQDMRPTAWEGETFDEREFNITTELNCNILHQVVVDPVRHIRTGALYERRAIYEHIDRDGKDPFDRLLVTRRDYVPSPRAKALAREVAEDILGATLVLV